MRRLYRRILGHICIYIYIKYINNNPREKYRRRQEDERSLASCLEWSVHRWGEREWRKTSRITTRFINLSKRKKGKTRYPTYGSCHTIVVRSMHASNILPSSHSRNGEWKHATPCATRISRTCMTFPRLLFCRKLLLCISPSWSFSLFLPFFLSSSLPSSTRRSNVSITRNTDDGWTFYRKLFCAFLENRCFDRCFSFLFAIGDWRTRKRLFTRMARNNDLFHSPRIFLRFLCILIERGV